MAERKQYRRRSDRPLIAVRLLLETEGFNYRKWGGAQHCKQGDWLVDNDGDVYTVDADSFAQTYEAVGLGTFVKTTPVWAERSDVAGSIQTREGHTHYAAGDYLVSNDKEGADSYAIDAVKFHALYELSQ
ncbi:MAG TPA: hypothetical protein VLC92_11175 [Rhodocyclaceae bacterium]|nr:hypothetical protein [Rhodocyclaceae bacterium]